MHRGYIKLWRKIKQWGWYLDSHTFHLFMHLLISATHEDCMYRGVQLKRGQVFTGLSKLNADTGISVQTIRTCMTRLKSTSEITSQSTNKYRVITICNYEEYQEQNIPPNKQTNKQTNKQLTNNQQTTNSIEEYKEHKEHKEHKENTRKTISLLPDDFSISENIRTWAKEKGYDRLEDRLEHFRDWAKGGSHKKADWEATFRNAIRGDWAHLLSNGKKQYVESIKDKELVSLTESMKIKIQVRGRRLERLERMGKDHEDFGKDSASMEILNKQIYNLEEKIKKGKSCTTQS